MVVPSTALGVLRRANIEGRGSFQLVKTKWCSVLPCACLAFTNQLFAPSPGPRQNRYIDAAEHRYVLSCKVADATGETFVNMFNNEVGGSSAKGQHC